MPNLPGICEKYYLDGVDMDWEYLKAASATASKILLAQAPLAAFKDNDGNIFYNGVPMHKRKVESANQSGCGIMIREISQGASDVNSLLSAIHERASNCATAVADAPAVVPCLILNVDAGKIRY